MTFSREEKQIWGNSEVMRELERIAKTQGLETPNEAFLPIRKGQDWEDERSDEEKLMDALEDFEEEDEKIKEQRDREVEFDEEKIMPVPEHEKELSNKNVGSTLDPENDDFLNQVEEEKQKENRREYGEVEVSPWNWRRTIEPTEVEANLIVNLTKLASYLGKQGKVVEANKVEDTIRDIRLTLREANNG